MSHLPAVHVFYQEGVNLPWIGSDLAWKKQKQELSSSMLVENKVPFSKGQVSFVVKWKAKREINKHCIMRDCYQKSKSCYSLAMSKCSILKLLLLNLMEFLWNLKECFDLLTSISLLCHCPHQKKLPRYQSLSGSLLFLISRPKFVKSL